VKVVTISQSNYIPWKGWFDLIAFSDEFILFDDVQYTRRDWRNRNQIKTPAGPIWLTIPVQVKGKYTQAIKDTLVVDGSWATDHFRTIRQNYARGAHFAAYEKELADIYETAATLTHLSAINELFTRRICGWLGIETKITRSMDYDVMDGKTERLLHLCKQAGATEYISGPSAKDYLDESLFSREGMSVRWFDNSGYAEYRQHFPPFVHAVSVLDLILNEGPDARRFLKAFAPKETPATAG
jgi:WbqC-like protein family